MYVVDLIPSDRLPLGKHFFACRVFMERKYERKMCSLDAAALFTNNLTAKTVYYLDEYVECSETEYYFVIAIFWCDWAI